jgi:hypothetical protein
MGIRNEDFLEEIRGERRSEAKVPPGSGGTPLQLTMGLKPNAKPPAIQTKHA